MSSPLGSRFWSLQLSEGLSLLADASFLWGGVWWVVMGRQPTLDEVMLVTGTGGLAWMLATPFAGVLADAFSRLRAIKWSLAARTLLHVLVAAAAWRQGLSAPLLAVFAALSGIGSAVFDAAAPPSALSFVAVQDQERALSYSLGLPRAGFYLTGIVCLLICATGGLPWLFAMGAFALLFSLAILSALPNDDRKPSASLPLLFLGGIKTFFTNPGLVSLGALLFVAHFVVHPLYSVSPAGQERIAPENLEVALCAGVVACAIFLGRMTKRISHVVLLGLGTCGLGVGLASLPLIPPWIASALIGVALMIVVGNASARVLLSTPDNERGRILSTSNLLYEMGADAGTAAVLPYVATHGANTTLYALGIPLIVLGSVLAFTRGLPAIRR